MLKTIRAGRAWLVTHADHSLLAGYIGAHWGNDIFRWPIPERAADADRLRAEVIFGIAQHDNGWWEWEADPTVTVHDRLPLGHIEVLRDHQAGVERWRRALNRFPQAPYGNLLIARHAYWLTAGRALPSIDPGFRHPLFHRSPQPSAGASENSPAGQFLAEMKELEDMFLAGLRADAMRQDWVRDDIVAHHTRLLQVCDGLSLSLCSDLMPTLDGASGFGEGSFVLAEVPRRDWHDRVEIAVTARGDGVAELDPYPFDTDPLTLSIPTKLVDPAIALALPLHTWWHATATRMIDIRYVSRRVEPGE